MMLYIGSPTGASIASELCCEVMYIFKLVDIQRSLPYLNKLMRNQFYRTYNRDVLILASFANYITTFHEQAYEFY